MKEILQSNSHTERHVNNAIRARDVVVGLIAGFVGTVVMDLFGVGLFLVMGGPASLSVSIIGDAAAGFVSLFGISASGGAPLGVVLHYLIGLVLGGILSVAVSRVDALHLDSARKAIGLGILYVELMSLPMLAAAAIVLKMTASETEQWFGVSFVMHLVYGAVLGGVLNSGLHRTTNAHLAPRT